MRYFGGALAFGFAAVWIMWSLAAALICLLAAIVGYCAVVVAERARARLAARARKAGGATSGSRSPGRTAEASDLSRQAEELNTDLGHVYKPSAATGPEDDSLTPRER